MIEQRDARNGPPPGLDARLIWTDPPFGTGSRRGIGAMSYPDHDAGHVPDTLIAWLPCLRADGVLAVCADYRLQHYVVNRLVRFGMEYHGDIVWTFGLGRPRTDWWPVRHNTISTFTWPGGRPKFDKTAAPRERRKAPKPGYPPDKPAGSVWDLTMSNTDPERVGYPDQKPVAIITPFIAAHTEPGDLVVDMFCGSGTTGVAASQLGREFYGCDLSPEACRVAAERHAASSPPYRSSTTATPVGHHAT